ncbi:hypothetical protein BE221DRAFT_70377 [Ostreococcus tauri]|uniref:Uncharacterized protein n=1 Tax=Ostreococcus tauri TaxID=70448 RepID=A0A1Y5IGN8_OSTTA|nr:hypothetical protein BE221DRAFT_70377 [Ostreococcus tauri]
MRVIRPSSRLLQRLLQPRNLVLQPLSRRRLSHRSPLRRRHSRFSVCELSVTPSNGAGNYFESLLTESAKPWAKTRIPNATAPGTPRRIAGSLLARHAKPTAGTSGASAMGHKFSYAGARVRALDSRVASSGMRRRVRRFIQTLLACAYTRVRASSSDSALNARSLDLNADLAPKMTTPHPPSTANTTCAPTATRGQSLWIHSSRASSAKIRSTRNLMWTRVRETRVFRARPRARSSTRRDTHVFFLPPARVHRIVPRVRHFRFRVRIRGVGSALGEVSAARGRRRGDAGALGERGRSAKGGGHVGGL